MGEVKAPLFRVGAACAWFSCTSRGRWLLVNTAGWEEAGVIEAPHAEGEVVALFVSLTSNKDQLLFQGDRLSFVSIIPDARDLGE